MHAVLAAVSCAMLAAPNTVVEFAAIPVMVFWMIRWPWMWRGARWTFSRPVVLLAACFFAWQGASLAWSSNRSVGIEEFGAARFAWGLVGLFCVLNRRRWFILALAAGFLAGNLSQLLHAAGKDWGVAWLQWAVWPRKAERNSGWWDPAVGGTLLVAALGLHLPAALLGLRRDRILGIAGSLITLIAIAATGTRGAWIAATSLVLFALAVTTWRAWRRQGAAPSEASGPDRGDHARRRRALSSLAIAAALLLIAAGAAWMAAGDAIRARYTAGRDEIRQALRDGDFNTDTGARLAMALWAWDAFKQHPLGGLGAGGFRHFVEEDLRRHGVNPEARALHDHAHNALLHAAATTGLVGASLFIATLAAGAVGLWRMSGIGAAVAPGYEAGPFFALVGLVFMTPFDTFQVNAQTSAILWLMLGLGAWGHMRVPVAPGSARREEPAPNAG